MIKELQYLHPELFVVDETEKDLPSGHIPERWMKIEDSQVAVWHQALEQQVAERQGRQTEEEAGARTTLIQHLLDEYFLEPSF
jgi:hypothetical protein